jgi:hypothetical protein
MSRALPFVLEAAAPSLYEDAMIAFTEKAAAHEWIGPGPSRVVVADDLVATMQKYMSDSDFDAWHQRQAARHAGSGAVGVGMAFVGRDGTRTAVVANLGSRDRVLWLFAHEYIEAAVDERLALLGFGEPKTPEDRHGRALWSEYVVERARRDVFSGLGWPPSDLDRSSLVESAANAQGARSGADPWPYVVLTLDLAKALARADAGVQSEQAAVEAFLAMDLAKGPWMDLVTCMRGAYKQPEVDPVTHDARAWSAWASIWRNRR